MTPAAIREVLIQELGAIAPEIDAGTVDPDANLREEMDIDSMDFLNLVSALHERLQVDVPETDYAKLESITKVVAYLAEKLGATPGR